jgi:tetratricopeptide (TPR) repeat protein
MRNAWLRTTAALICLAGYSGANAVASPALMAMHGHGVAEQESSSIWPWSKPTTAAPAPGGYPTAATPAQKTSSHNPITFLKSTASKLPFGSKVKGASAQRASMPPAQNKPDAISLSTPTGPPSPEFFIYAAQVCENQSDIQQARNNYQRALTMWPGHVEVLRAAARMEDRQGNLPLAENLYGQAVTSNPQDARALNDLGLCLARQGKLDPALQLIEQAVQLQPAKPLYRNNAATVLIEMRQDQRALAHLAAVHGPADANYNIGQLLVERGRAADAAPYFQAALQQNPGMVQAQEALAKLQGSQVAVATQPAVAPFTPVAQATAPAAQNFGPQQQLPANPQLSYPTTARMPANEASSSAQPRYLPPVANRPVAPGGFRR